MPIDPTGTTPGLAPEPAPPQETVNIRCRRVGCDSMQAIEIKIPTPEHVGRHLYRCAKCGNMWSVSLGGHIDI